MKNFDFSPELKLPLSVCTQKLAFLGISGSGKTYGAGKLVEGVIEAGAQVIVVDIVGNWFGLRLAADGKKPGISIPVLGGARGDVPLDSYAGKQVAELVIDSGSSMVLDISDFTAAETRRFVIDFATRLLALKKHKPSPTLVVWEECQDIVPQKSFGEDGKMVGAVTRLIKKGRNYGIGTVLISQRPAAVAKEVLNQCETLFVFRLVAKHDRRAIQDWIVDNDVDVGKLVDTLPKLTTGTCYCWSPQFLEVLTQIRIGRKLTFNASATPEFGDVVRAGALAPVDLEKFKKTMADAVEKAKENDPVELRKQLAEANHEVSKWKGLHATVKPEPREFDKEQVKKIMEAASSVAGLEDKLEAAISAAQGVKGALIQLDTKIRLAESSSFNRTMVVAREQAKFDKAARWISPHPVKDAAEKFTNTRHDVSGGARRMLQQLASRYPDATTRVQLATLSGFSPRSGTFATYLSQLNVAGFMETVRNGEVSYLPTQAGLEFLGGDFSERVTGRALLESWCGKLGGKTAEMLRVLASKGESGLTRDEVAASVDLSPGSGTFATYLSKLNSNGLIVKRHGRFMAAGDFR